MSERQLQSLADLSTGQVGVVARLDGDEAVCMHLMELGFTPGEPVMLVGRSLAGDPLAVQLRGTRIALRLSEAACIRTR